MHKYVVILYFFSTVVLQVKIRYESHITDHTTVVTVANTVSAPPDHFGIEGRKYQSKWCKNEIIPVKEVEILQLETAFP